MSMAEWIGGAFAILAAVGVIYQLIGLFAVRRFFARPAPSAAATEPVTLLKPLHGAEPLLADNLSTFLQQDWPESVQMVCGARDSEDPSLTAVEQLRRAHPDADIAIVTGHPPLGSNNKIANLVHMMPAARHDLLVLSDSDIAVRPDYLRNVAGALEQPGVGAASCLYLGRAVAGVWSHLNAAIVSYSGTPKVVMSRFTRAAQPCMGSTIAIRRETLLQIGGFERFADVLADDHALGEAVVGLGKTIALPPILLDHACIDASFSDLWRHHLRWAVTIRGVEPLLHVLSGVVYAVPFALLTVPLLPLTGLALLLAALAVRFATVHTVDAIAGRKSAPFRLVPVADCIEFAVYVASLAVRTIHWRGSRLNMSSDGRIRSATENP